MPSSLIADMTKASVYPMHLGGQCKKTVYLLGLPSFSKTTEELQLSRIMPDVEHHWQHLKDKRSHGIP